MAIWRNAIVLAALLVIVGMVVSNPVAAVAGPEFVFPTNSQRVDLEGDLLAQVEAVDNATAYEWQVVNRPFLADASAIDETTVGPNLSIAADVPERSDWTPGPTTIAVRAIVDGAPPTEFSVVTVDLQPRENVPVFVLPDEGQTLDLEGAYIFEVFPVPGAVGYRWSLIQRLGVSIYAQSQPSDGPTFAFLPGTAAHDGFRGGPARITVNAIMDDGTETAVRTRDIVLRPRPPVITTPSDGDMVRVADGLTARVDPVRDASGYLWVLSQPGQGPDDQLIRPTTDPVLELDPGTAYLEGLDPAQPLTISVQATTEFGPTTLASTVDVEVTSQEEGSATVTVTFLSALACDYEREQNVGFCGDGPDSEFPERTQLQAYISQEFTRPLVGDNLPDDNGDFPASAVQTIEVPTVDGKGIFGIDVDANVNNPPADRRVDISPILGQKGIVIEIDTNTATWRHVGVAGSENQGWSTGRGEPNDTIVAASPAGVNFDIAFGSNPDIDNDGLLDNWERQGRGLEVIDITLPSPLTTVGAPYQEDMYAIGARVGTQDLFYEFDWSDADPIQRTFDAGRTCSDIDESVELTVSPGPLWESSLQGGPNQCGLDYADISAAFARHGIALRFDTGSFVAPLAAPPGAFGDDLRGGRTDRGGGPVLVEGRDCVGDDLPDSYRDAKDRGFNDNRRWTFRYILQIDVERRPDRPNCAGGAAFTPGTDIWMRRGDATALMHEIGHSLGLGHGGTDDQNCSANHVSIMNYQYSVPIPAIGFGSDDNIRYVMDFSPADRGLGPLQSQLPLFPDIDTDQSLDETAPLLPGAGDLRIAYNIRPNVFDFVTGVERFQYATNADGFDFNRDGDRTDTDVTAEWINYDLTNGSCKSDARSNILDNTDEWAVVPNFVPIIGNRFGVDEIGDGAAEPTLSDHSGWPSSSADAKAQALGKFDYGEVEITTAIDGPVEIAPGTAASLVGTVTNEGSLEGSGAVIGVRVSGATAASTDDRCQPATDRDLVCQVGTLAPGAQTTLAFTVTPDVDVETVTVEFAAGGNGFDESSERAFAVEVPAGEPCAPGQPGVIYGTAGRDVLRGTNGDDIICGLGGNDLIYGRQGNDIIYGGAGRDSIVGGNGADRLYGEAGNDWLWGGNGSDELFGGEGRDTLVGGRGSDALDGGAGNDRLYGGNGHDELIGGAGRDGANGGRGTDTCIAEWTYSCRVPSES